MGGRVVVVLAVLAALTGCSGDGGDAGEAGDAGRDDGAENGDDGADDGGVGGGPDGRAIATTEELCPAFDDWREQDVWAPFLTDLSPMTSAELEAYLDGRERRIERLVTAADAADLELAADVTEVRQLHDDLRTGWGDDGSVLRDEALANEVEIEQLTGRATPVISSAVVATLSPICDDEPEDWEPIGAREASELPTVEPTVMAVDLDDESLLLLLPDGDEVTTPLDDVIRYQNTDRRPHDGAVLVNAIVDAGEGEVVDRVITGDTVDDLGIATPGTELWTCARWAVVDESADTIGFARWRGPSDWVAATADLATGEVVELDVPAARIPTRVCPLVTDQGVFVAVDHVLEQHPVGGGDPVPVAELPGCAILDPIVQPGTDAISFLARCTNVYDEGYYRVTPGGEPERLVDGVMGSASWSGDGDTLVIAAFDGGEFAGIRTVSIADGDIALVSDSRSLWPIFTERP